MGLMGAQQLLMMPKMQQFMGGNIIGAYQNLFAGRSSVTPGFMSPDNPLMGVGFETVRGAGAALQSRIYSDSRGRASPLPDYNFTRGFAIDDIAGMVSEASRGGRKGFMQTLAQGGGTLNPAMSEVGNLTGAMQSLSGMMGSSDMTTLMSTLNRLTNNKWATMNWGGLQQQLGKMAEMARMLDMSGTQMVGTIQAIQSAAQSAVGVTPLGAAMGDTGGHFGGLTRANRQMARMATISVQNGISPGTPAWDAMAYQQTELDKMGLMSEAGRTSTVIEEMAGRGMIPGGRTNPLYQGYVTSMMQGSPATRAAARNRFFDAFGGRENVNNLPYINRIREQEDVEGQRAEFNTSGQLQFAQAHEYGYRIAQSSAGALRGIMGGMAADIRKVSLLTPAESAHMDMQVAQDYFTQQAKNAGVDTERGKFFTSAAAGIGESFNRGRADALGRGYSEQIAAGQGSAYANQYMSVGALQQYRPEIESRQRQAATKAWSSFEGSGAASYLENARTTAGLNAMLTLGSNAGIDTQRLAAISTQYQTDPHGAASAVTSLISSLSPSNRSVVEQTMTEAGDRGSNKMRSAAVQATLSAVQVRAIGSGYTPDYASTNIASLSNQLLGVASGGSTSGLLDSLGDKNSALRSLLPQDQYDKLVATVKGGDVGAIGALGQHYGAVAAGYTKSSAGVSDRLGVTHYQRGIMQGASALYGQGWTEIQAAAGQVSAERINQANSNLTNRSIGQIALAVGMGQSGIDNLVGLQSSDPKALGNGMRNMALNQLMGSLSEITLSKGEQKELDAARENAFSTDVSKHKEGESVIAKLAGAHEKDPEHQQKKGHGGSDGKMTITGVLRIINSDGTQSTAQVTAGGK